MIARLLPLLLLALSIRAGAAPTRVILMIGDGMGVGQLTATREAHPGLNMERLRSGGLVFTEAADQRVTDSAAAATALATGVSTNNGVIGLSPAGDTLRTVLELAAARGMATGLVVTCRVTHATPASFAAHVLKRDMEDAIAAQLALAPLDVLFGYGWGQFVPSGEQGSRRHDDMDLRPTLRQRFRSLAFSPAEYTAARWQRPALALLAADHGGPAAEREISLARMTQDALALLSLSDGFFLMVEGSQIDWSGHGNDFQGVINETLDFDAAVGVALDFAIADGHTLLVVTADHETGGLSLPESGPSWGATHHTSAAVPLLAWGPGSENFSGLMPNHALGAALIQAVSASTP